ncbi:capsid and scaffold protein [Staphylococcus phage pSco-10]|nr:capsid and scaffold protein [Staphylococcus phage pSco-10]
MAFNYTPLTETQKLKDMYPKVNDIGNFLKTEVNPSDLKVISQPDFNNILDKIPDSGNYYVTTSTNFPPGENRNGFVRLDKRNSRYYKVYYSPFNSNKMYIKTYADKTVYDWISFKLDEGNLYNEGNTLNVKELTESTTQYATLINPLKENLNTGWVNYKESKNGVSSLVEFNPVNSTSTFKMIRKLPVQEQNPNLLRDSLFEETQYNLKPYTDRNSNWKWDTIDTSDTSITNDISFEGNKTAKVTNNGTAKYPIIRSRGLEIGKDVQPGEELTFSTYLYVPSLEAMKDNAFYIQVDKYTDDLLDVNTSIQSAKYYKADLKEKEWQRLTVTATVPPESEAKYIACAMRITTVNSGTGTGMTGYYALPKLEKGNKATPFITHQDDKVQYDEIWSNWSEYADEQSILNNYTSDVDNRNYFKYAWFENDVNGMSLKDLIMTVPQGYHTFYCQGSIEGTPRGRSIRGTIQVDYDKGDPNSTNKFIKLVFTDSEGIPYTLYYGGYNYGWKPLKQQRTSTILWEGTLDYGSKDTIPLNDSWTNYDMLEVVYITKSAGHYKTMFLDLRTPTTPYLYIRDFNLANDSTGSGVDFFEGYLSFPTTTSATPNMAKQVTLNGSTNTTSVSGYNAQGIITIYRIAGINTL